MSDNPWMKFYPRDWRGDQALRAVSIAARGLWIECLCIMHEAKPYGHLVLNGAPVDGDTLARMTGVPVDEVSALLAELRQAGVLSVTGKGGVFSRRMTSDHARAQKGRIAIKKRWSQDSDYVEQSEAPNRSPNRIPNRIPITQKPEARSQRKIPGSFANAQQPAPELPLELPSTAEPVTQKKKGAAAGSAEERFWALAPQATGRGIARSSLGQLANLLNGDFERGVGIITDVLAAKVPRPYLARIIKNVEAERALPKIGLPAWVQEAKASGYPVTKEGRFWRMSGALYDDEGEQIGN